MKTLIFLTIACTFASGAYADDRALQHTALTFGPGNFLHHADELYSQKDRLGAARELLKAASMLDVVSDFNKDASEAQKQLRSSATELRKLAAQVKDGQVLPTLSILELTMAKANIAMAFHHFNASGDTVEDEEGQEAHLAGHHLLAAAQYMEEAGKLSGKAPTKPAVDARKKLSEHATRIVTDEKPPSAALEKLKQEFADHLRKLGEDLENQTAGDPEAK